MGRHRKRAQQTGLVALLVSPVLVALALATQTPAPLADKVSAAVSAPAITQPQLTYLIKHTRVGADVFRNGVLVSRLNDTDGLSTVGTLIIIKRIATEEGAQIIERV